MGAGAGRKNHRLTALQIEPCARPLLFLVSRGSDTRLSFVTGETPLDAPLDTGETPLDMGEILLPIDLLPLGVETPKKQARRAKQASSHPQPFLDLGFVPSWSR